MLRSVVVLALSLALAGAGPQLAGGRGAPSATAAPSTAAPSSPAAAPPVHSVSVAGTGVAMYPAFDPSVERYGVTTTAGTTGKVTVTATTSDPRGTVLVNGRPTTGSRTISGLVEGDEISVIIDDAAGHAGHSLIYLPAGFPALERTTPASADVTPGHVLLTLSTFAGGPFFETAVDRNGVPVHVHTETGSSIAFKRQPDGTMTSSRPWLPPGLFRDEGPDHADGARPPRRPPDVRGPEHLRGAAPAKRHGGGRRDRSVRAGTRREVRRIEPTGDPHVQFQSKVGRVNSGSSLTRPGF